MIGTRRPTHHHDCGGKHHASQAKLLVMLLPACGHQQGLDQEQHKERTHQHGVRMQHQREGWPHAGLDGGDFLQRAGDESGERDGDEPHRHQHEDPSIDEAGQRAARRRVIQT
jgi:hypothetical protein